MKFLNTLLVSFSSFFSIQIIDIVRMNEYIKLSTQSAIGLLTIVYLYIKIRNSIKNGKSPTDRN
jgi:hypothetical protein